MSDKRQGYMLDTVTFNRAADGKISPSSFVGRRVIVTGIQLDELRATQDPNRRARLLATFEELKPSTIPASSFALGIEGAGLNQAYWNDGTGNFENMLDRLRVLDQKSRKKPKDCRNQMRDILIAETAIKNDAVLVSDDQNLRQVASEFGGLAIDHAQFNRG